MPFQDANTAPMPPHSCSRGSSGKGLPSTFRIVALNRSASVLEVVGGEVGVGRAAAGLLDLVEHAVELLADAPALGGSMPAAFSMTTSEYIMIRRR